MTTLGCGDVSELDSESETPERATLEYRALIQCNVTFYRNRVSADRRKKPAINEPTGAKQTAPGSVGRLRNLRTARRWRRTGKARGSVGALDRKSAHAASAGRIPRRVGSRSCSRGQGSVSRERVGPRGFSERNKTEGTPGQVGVCVRERDRQRDRQTDESQR